jgi:two-component system CheB/CheR fusion protein
MEQPDQPVSSDATPAAPPAHTGGPPFPVVGLGASAGGLQALQTFFDHTPPDTGMAFVVVLHLSPTYPSTAAGLLQQHTAMPVQQVTDTAPLRPNQVYVIPPAQQLELRDGEIRLAEPATEQDRHAAIDHCFRTLADTHDGHAIAIILSGTGSDGTIGSGRIKERGGAVFVQDPEEAEFSGMPRSAIASGFVDAVLPVAQLPTRLHAYWQRMNVVTGTGAAALDGGDGAVLQEILAVLRVRTRHDFSQYKLPMVLRRIGRRMQVVGVDTQAAYVEVLRGQPDEVDALLKDLLISVTNFFRDPAAWAALQAILPQLFAGKGPTDQVRVWVPACATGEEAYSVAMVLLEHALTLDHPPALQVFATDIHDAAIASARRAVYPETIAGDVAPERLRRFFVFEQGRYRIKQELRELVMFATHNILRDPPFTKLDLVTCRNLLIYLNRAAQEQVVTLFEFSLRPGGYLLLGTAEALDAARAHFATIAKAQHLYQRVGWRATPPLVPFGGTRPLPPPAPAPSQPATPGGSAAGGGYQRLLAAHAPPSVLVTADYEILHLSRGASRWLQLEGDVSTNVLRFAHPDLRLPLQTALMEATQQARRSERRDVRVTVDDMVYRLDLMVEPVADADVPQGSLLVLFHASDPVTAAPPAPTTGNGQVRELAAELERTREQLRTTIEQYASSNEEYKAANEELQAINEELRAVTEELETSKEELQAVNEELHTVNQELKHTIDETTATSNDLQNLIAATQIATLFLDRELRVTRYTPTAESIFNLIPTDRGRPLAHVTHSLPYQGLPDDAAQVLRSLIPIEHEFMSTTGTWYLVQVGPYRTTDDHIAGVVLTFVDITVRKQREQRLAEQARLLDLSNDAIIVRNVDNRIVYWNHGATELYGWTRVEAIGQDQHTLLRTEFEMPIADLLATLQQHDRMEGEVVQVTKDGRRIDAWSRWALDRDAEGRPGAILTTYNDITVRKRTEARLRESEAQFRAIAEVVPDLLWSSDARGTILWHNQRWYAYTGQTLEAALGAGWLDALHPEDRERSWNTFQGAIAGGQPLRQEHRIRRADGMYRWFLSQALPLRDDQGAIVRWYGAWADIHDQRVALEAAEAALTSREHFLSIASHELRTPLTSLLGYAYLLSQAVTQGRGDPVNMAGLITRQAQRLNLLIDQLLDVSRLQRGQFAIEPMLVDVAAVVEQVVDEVRLAQPSDTTHPIALTGPGAPVIIAGDAPRLEQVLENLLSNAIKYSPAGGPIHVQVRRTATDAIIEVTDQGMGIPPAAQARLFEAFYRAQNTGTQISGFGLGLHIVQEIVQRHGGRIEVDSTEGVGSTFRVVLPLADSSR